MTICWSLMIFGSLDTMAVKEVDSWACQTMAHWSDRVKEKCKTNKSYAIAHGLA